MKNVHKPSDRLQPVAKFLSLCVLSANLCLGCPCGQTTLAKDRPTLPTEDSDSTERTTEGVQLSLRRRQDGGYDVNAQNAKKGIYWNAPLISIDNRDLRNLTEKEIESLIKSHAGSAMHVSVLSRTGKEKAYSLKCEPANLGPMWERKLQHLVTMDSRSDSHWNSGYTEDSMDIEARSAQNLILRIADEKSEVSANSLASALICASLTNYQLGNLPTGDSYLKQGLKVIDPTQNFRLGQNWHIRKATTLLLEMDKSEEAMQLLENEARSNKSMMTVEGYKEWILTKIQNDRQEAIKRLDTIISNQRSQGSGQNCFKWMGDVYMSVGDYKKALDVYNKCYNTANFQTLSWEPIQLLSQIALPLALAQCKTGDRDGAINNLDSIIKRFERVVPTDQVAVIERMPGVYPKVSDLKVALADLRALKDVKDIKVKLDIEPLTHRFPPVRKCHHAIAAGDEKTTKQCLDELLLLYKGNVPEPLKAIGDLNLFSTVLSLTREMVNRGWNILADDTLTRLKNLSSGKDTNPVTEAFLQFEVLYNAKDSGKIRETQWKILRGLYSKDKVPYTWSESLRQLAVSYYYADELDRAEYLIESALKEWNNEIGHPRASSQYGGTGGDKTMLLIYAACIAAQQKKYEKSELYWNQFIAEPQLSQEGYRQAAIELSSVYLKNGNKNKAISILEAIHKKPDEPAREVGASSTELNLRLAKLLLEDGKRREAYSIAKSAEKLMTHHLEWEQILIIAKCAEAVGDKKLAALSYGQAYRVAGGNFLFTNDGKGPNYQEKAVVLAEQIPDFDKKELIELYKAYRTSIPPEQLDQRLSASQRAYALMLDSDPEKPQLLPEIASLNSIIEANKKKNNDALKDLHISDEYLSAQVQAAQLAEKNHQLNTRNLWANVAFTKAARGDTQSALTDINHVMQLYTIKNAANHEPVFVHSNFVYWLVKDGKKSEAEKLLLDAVEKTKTVTGKNSICTQAQNVDLFEFYIKEKNFTAAGEALDSALIGDFTTGETLTQYMNVSHCGPGWPQSATSVELVNSIFKILETIKDTQQDFVASSLKKVLNAQDTALKPEDERLVPTLANLGDISFEQRKYTEAERFYDRAYSITKQYHTGEFAVRQVGKHFLENLRKLGKAKEADKLADLD